MTTIGFIGLGNMGGPMVRNLAKAGYSVTGFDVVAANVAAAGVRPAASAAEAVRDADAVVTMLPEGAHVRTVYLGQAGIIGAARKGTLLLDS